MQLRWPATFALALTLLLAVANHRSTLDVSRASTFPAAPSGVSEGELVKVAGVVDDVHVFPQGNVQVKVRTGAGPVTLTAMASLGSIDPLPEEGDTVEAAGLADSYEGRAQVQLHSRHALSIVSRASGAPAAASVDDRAAGEVEASGTVERVTVTASARGDLLLFTLRREQGDLGVVFFAGDWTPADRAVLESSRRAGAPVTVRGRLTTYRGKPSLTARAVQAVGETGAGPGDPARASGAPTVQGIDEVTRRQGETVTLTGLRVRRLHPYQAKNGRMLLFEVEDASGAAAGGVFFAGDWEAGDLEALEAGERSAGSLTLTARVDTYRGELSLVGVRATAAGEAVTDPGSSEVQLWEAVPPEEDPYGETAGPDGEGEDLYEEDCASSQDDPQDPEPCEED